MAPALIDTHQNGATAQNGHTNTNKVQLPLKSNGSLAGYNYNDLTPNIGREFPSANLVDMMDAPNADELLTELALTSKLHHAYLPK